ncbi:MAG TPA: OmpA family protein [Dongiaceae bacterium]|nr:OmpA family protein [Dongiaceae bacterium]
MRNVLCVFLVGVLALGPLACSSMNKTEKGAVIGGAAGAGVGAVIGHAAGNTAVGAIIGAAVGGAAGAYIGHYMDKQAEEMRRDLAGAKIERVGEGIKITFASGILFEVDHYNLQPDAETNLANLSRILNKYEDTNILIEGHTDSDGSVDYNQTLSERRASSVAHFLAEKSVQSGRMNTVGYGETQPIADNSTRSGKAANRRVEVAIMANDKLKKAAEAQAGE